MLKNPGDFGVHSPGTSAAAAALWTCQEYAEPWLLNHSLRTYAWAAAYADRTGIDHDSELLYVAAMLHDLALTDSFLSHALPFEEASGHLARVFAAGAGWPESRRDRLREVIVLHMRANVPATDDPESHLLQVGVSADVSGSRLPEFSSQFQTRVIENHPRLGFTERFLARLSDEAERKPSCAA